MLVGFGFFWLFSILCILLVGTEPKGAAGGTIALHVSPALGRDGLEGGEVPPPPLLHLVNGTGNSPSPGQPTLE